MGGDSQLSCAQMRHMQPVALEKMDVDQIEVQPTNREGISQASKSIVAHEQTHKTFDTREAQSCDSQVAEAALDSHAYDDFLAFVFSNVTDSVSRLLRRGSAAKQLDPPIRLLFDLVQSSKSEKVKRDRTFRCASDIAETISYLLDTNLQDGASVSISVCLKSLCLLLEGEAQLPGEPLNKSGRKREQKPKTEIVCEVHNIPAVRRRSSSKGVNKDRRFYVCGKERGERCDFFKWADEVGSTEITQQTIPSSMRNLVRSALWSPQATNPLPLHVRLCRKLETEFFADCEGGKESKVENDGIPLKKFGKMTPISSHYGAKEAAKDFADGVFCCREKIRGVSFEDLGVGVAKKTEHEFSTQPVVGDKRIHLLTSCLNLLVLIADHKTEGITRWFSLLCEIESSISWSADVRGIAKRTIKSLCGKNKTLCHLIRDHLSYGFHMKKLYAASSEILSAALLIGEKARVCGYEWARTKPLNWSNLKISDLMGADELISEDIRVQYRLRKISGLLDGLWNHVRNCGESWRRFCGLALLPQPHRDTDESDLVECTVEQLLAEKPPIVCLFWVACAISDGNQVKVLRLIELALAESSAKSCNRRTAKGGPVMADAIGNIDEDVVNALGGVSPSSPENLLFSGEQHLSVEDLQKFILHFVLGGKNLELRRAAFNIFSHLVTKLSVPKRSELFRKLMSRVFLHLGSRGRGSIEYLNVLQLLANDLDSSTSVGEFGDLVLDGFVQQMTALKFDRSNGEWFVLELHGPGAPARKKFDLAECTYCVQNYPGAMKDLQIPADGSSVERSHAGADDRRGGAIQPAVSAASQPQRKWHREQVGPLLRSRLESLKHSNASNEFCSYFSLKNRAVISDIYVSVHDPKGRFVKTITVYYTPRPSGDATDLRGGEYDNQWQRCAVLRLPRGASRASASLPHLLVVSNLRFEFSEFYERPGGSKSTDGTLLVHCPRCTRGKLGLVEPSSIAHPVFDLTCLHHGQL